MFDDLAITTTRRRVLGGAAGLAAVGALGLASKGSGATGSMPGDALTCPAISHVRTRDGAEIAYKSWGSGPAILFSHGWPLNADDWEDQLLFFANHGFRAIAHDRRGHGRSSQAWNGNDIDGYADDLGAVMDALDLRNVVLVGHSTGGGEVARYIGRHGNGRLRKAVLVSGIPPLRLRTAANPGGAPMSAFDDTRRSLLADRAQFYHDLSIPFFGVGRSSPQVSAGVREAFWLQCMSAGVKAVHDGIRAQTETDFTADLRRFEVPTLIVHGSEDQLVPIADSAPLQKQLIRNATLSVYDGAPHGLTFTHRDRFNADLLAFAKS